MIRDKPIIVSVWAVMSSVWTSFFCKDPAKLLLQSLPLIPCQFELLQLFRHKCVKLDVIAKQAIHVVTEHLINLKPLQRGAGKIYVDGENPLISEYLRCCHRCPRQFPSVVNLDGRQTTQLWDGFAFQVPWYVSSSDHCSCQNANPWEFWEPWRSWCQ